MYKKVYLAQENKTRKLLALPIVGQVKEEKQDHTYFQQMKKWSKEHGPKARSRRSILKRHHDVAQATPLWVTSADMRRVDEMKAALTRQTGEQWTIDHDIPLHHPLVCGLNCPDNIVLMPRSDNAAKGNDWSIE